MDLAAATEDVEEEVVDEVHLEAEELLVAAEAVVQAQRCDSI